MSDHGVTTTALVKAPTMAPATVSVLTPQGYQAALSLAKTLCESGFLPRSVQKPAQALAIILAGQELGLPPMTALRQIHVVEGKPTLSAELMLSLFKKRGGHARWVESTDKRAVLWLRHPNGDEHTEEWTLEDALRAGVTSKDNWRKYPKAMLRARCISGGIRALGEADGMYEPEEIGEVAAMDDIATVAEAPAADPKETVAETSSPSARPAESGDEDPAGSTSQSDEPAEGEWRDLVECWTWKGAKGNKKWGEGDGDWVSIGTEPQRSQAQNAKLHALWHELGVKDEDRRGRLIRNYNKQSSADLSVREAAEIIDRLESAKARFGTKADKDARKQARVDDVRQTIEQDMRDRADREEQRSREPGEEG